jgi:peroxiredoxin
MLRLFWIVTLLGMFTATAVASEAKNFSYPDLDGKIHQLSDYRGKWVLVNYWATWCPPCLEEIPELEVFHNNHKDTLAVVLGVSMEGINSDKLREFVEDQFISYPILLAGDDVSQLLGKVPGLPTSYLVDPRGEVVAREVGPIDSAAIEKFIHDYKPLKEH